jgi:Raf kinase inhibitor-like YbhB/YbcL family protein
MPEPDVPETAGGIQVTSPAFAEGDTVPVEFTCQGEGVSPPLEWSGVPDGTGSLILTLADPDAPSGDFVHWRVTGIDPSAAGVERGQVPAGGSEEENSAGQTGYAGPCPPPGPAHRYIFTVEALSADGEVLASGSLTGTYGR